MGYLKNHCWCSDSNWGGHYDCKIIVSLNSYKDGYKEDWDRLIITKEYLDEKSYQFIKKAIPVETEEDLISRSMIQVNALKPEVLGWLETNVLDFEGIKGWCVGSDSYTNDACLSYSVFFQRRKDAMKFIKTWGIWKKTLHYCQYFTDVRKRLNAETEKYERY